MKQIKDYEIGTLFEFEGWLRDRDPNHKELMIYLGFKGKYILFYHVESERMVERYTISSFNNFLSANTMKPLFDKE